MDPVRLGLGLVGPLLVGLVLVGLVLMSNLILVFDFLIQFLSISFQFEDIAVRDKDSRRATELVVEPNDRFPFLTCPHPAKSVNESFV